MPAAAVIPAPKAYINVVAVKKLVVGYLAHVRTARPRGSCAESAGLFSGLWRWAFSCRRLRSGSFTLKKSACSKQAYAVNVAAWNNNIGLAVQFCWFLDDSND